jgi:Tfp pilus assembly protein PilN
LRSAAEQAALIDGSLHRFFVSDGAPMRTSAAVHSRDGELWAGAVNTDVVAALVQACRVERFRFIGVAPVAAVLGRLAVARTGDPRKIAEVQHTDDGTSFRVRYEEGSPVGIHRERAPLDAPCTTIGDLALSAHAPPSHADALAASRLERGDDFLVSEGTDEDRRIRARRVRTRSWLSIAAACVVLAAALPGILSLRRSEKARARLGALSAGRRELQRVQTSLAASSATLGNVASFERSRRSSTLLLAELAMALPESTAVTALHIDSLGGSLTVLAPHAAATLEGVAAIPIVARVQMAGAVNREIAAGAELERATLRFTIRRAPRTDRGAQRTGGAR